MDLLTDDADEALIESIRAVLARELPVANLRSRIQSPPATDPGFWKLAGSLGWFAASIEDSLGGAGMGFTAEVLLVRELGRSLVPGPVIPTILAARLAAGLDQALFERLASGEVFVGLAEPQSVVSDDGLWWDALGAELVLTVDQRGAALFRVPDGDLDRRRLPSIDPLVSLHAGEQRSLGPPVLTVEDSHYWERGTVLSAALLVGIAEATLADSVSHATVRHQFGKPIGAYQAVKHRCADMATRVEAARCQLFFAAISVDMAAHGARRQALAAKLVATDAAIRNASDNIQNHGGAGFTEESNAHLFLRRARAYEHFLPVPASGVEELLAGEAS